MSNISNPEVPWQSVQQQEIKGMTTNKGYLIRWPSHQGTSNTNSAQSQLCGRSFDHSGETATCRPHRFSKALKFTSSRSTDKEEASVVPCCGQQNLIFSNVNATIGLVSPQLLSRIGPWEPNSSDVTVCGRLTSASSQASMQPLVHPQAGKERKLEELKVRKFKGRDK